MRGTRHEGPESKVDAEVNRILQGLRAWIAKSGKAHREIAEASGLGVTSLSAILRGAKALCFEDASAILAALGATPREFFRELYHLSSTTAAPYPPTTSSHGSGAG